MNTTTITESTVDDFVLQEVKPLWPRWDPTGPQLAVWGSVFVGLQWDIAKDAVRRHYRDSDRLHPHIPGIRRHLPRMKEGMTYPSLPRPGLWIMYYGGGETSMRPGFYDAVSEHVLEMAVDQMQATYGGDWRVLRHRDGWTAESVQAKSHELWRQQANQSSGVAT